MTSKPILCWLVTEYRNQYPHHEVRVMWMMSKSLAEEWAQAASPSHGYRDDAIAKDVVAALGGMFAAGIRTVYETSYVDPCDCFHVSWMHYIPDGGSVATEYCKTDVAINDGFGFFRESERVRKVLGMVLKSHWPADSYRGPWKGTSEQIDTLLRDGPELLVAALEAMPGAARVKVHESRGYVSRWVEDTQPRIRLLGEDKGAASAD